MHSIEPLESSRSATELRKVTKERQVLNFPTLIQFEGTNLEHPHRYLIFYGIVMAPSIISGWDGLLSEIAAPRRIRTRRQTFEERDKKERELFQSGRWKESASRLLSLPGCLTTLNILGVKCPEANATAEPLQTCEGKLSCSEVEDEGT